MGFPMLEGNVDTRDEQIRQLERDLHRAEGELGDARAELQQARRENAKAIANLRRQLSPLYQALQQVFGEIEAIGGEEENAPAPTGGLDDRQKKVWNSWKERLGQTASKVIDALMTHGELNTQQLSIATGLHRTTVPTGIHALNKAGLINKNGGRFSLKQL